MALACLAAAMAASARPQDDPAQILMRDGFEEAGFSSAGGLFYKDNPEQRAGSIRFIRGHAFTGEGSVTRHADLPPAQKGWIDFVMRSRPGPKGDGHVEILADGVHLATVKGRIGHDGADLGSNQYFKFGPYREPGALPWSVSYGDFRRGPRCADVMRRDQCPPE
jgi:hypothetical protein